MDRKAHWEEVYRNKSPQVVSWYQAEPMPSLELIRSLAPSTAARVIDVGGGASMLVDRLLDAGYRNLSVLDLSGTAIMHARDRLGVRAGRVEWFEADITDFESPHTFELWHDRAVFHFLTDEDDRRRYRDNLLRTLAPGGHLVLGTFALSGPNCCSGLEVVQYDAPRILTLFGDMFELVDAIEQTHYTPAGKAQQFAYFSLVLRKTVPKSVGQAGHVR